MMARTRQLGWFRGRSQTAQEIVKAALTRVEMFDLRDRHWRAGGHSLSGGRQLPDFSFFFGVDILKN
jgi:manganese/iron transport system ATP-binding protein